MKRYSRHIILFLSFLAFSADSFAQGVKEYFNDKDGFFFFIGIDVPKKNVNLVWDEISNRPIKSYILERSTDGNVFIPVIIQSAVNKPKDIREMSEMEQETIQTLNAVVYSTESEGKGRFVFNELINNDLIDKNYVLRNVMTNRIKWEDKHLLESLLVRLTEEQPLIYRIKFIYSDGSIQYSGQRSLSDYLFFILKRGILKASDGNSTQPNNNSSSISLTLANHTTSTHLDKNDLTMPLAPCPSINLPPACALATGNSNFINGTCCNYTEQEFKEEQPGGPPNIPCSQSNKGLGYCTPLILDCVPASSDKCCAGNGCEHYAVCTCKPWECCVYTLAPTWYVVESNNLTPPTAAFTYNNVCLGQTTTFTDGSFASGNSGVIITYAWNFGDGNTSATQNPTHLYTAVGTYTITLTITTNKGCVSIVTNVVTVNPQPVANFSVITVCFGIPTQFTNLSTGGGTQWSWNFGDGNTSTQQSPSHTYTATGTYTVTLTSTGTGGCSSTIPKIVTVNPQPVANFSVITVCFGIPTQFTNLSTGGGTQWSWNFGDGNISTQQNPSHTYTSSGTYTATLTSTGTGGCSSTIPKIVTVFPQPVANFNATTVCLGNPTLFTNQTTGGGSVWSWNFGDGNSSNQQNPSNTYSASGTYTATMNASDIGGCNSNFTKVISVYPQPVAIFSVSTVCFGLPTQFTDQSIGGGTQWSWNFGDGNTSTQQNPSHTYTIAGTYTATLTSTGTGGCNSANAKQVTVFPLAVANFNKTDICLNTNPAVFTDMSIEAVQWTWNFGDGTPGSTQQNPVHIYGAPGTYSVSLVVQSGGGCTDSITRTINVNPVPDAIFTSNVVCFNNPTQFTDQSLGVPVQWTWNFGDGNSSTSQNPSYTFGTSGTFTVTLIVTNSLGCSDTLPRTAIIYPVPAVNFSAPTVCIGSSTCFTDMTTISSGVFSSWGWNFNDLSSGANNISNIQHPCHLFTKVGTYNVLLTVTSNNNCQGLINLPVRVTVPPVAAFTATNVCLNSPTSFTDGSTGAVQWSWDFGDGGTSTAQNPSHIYLGYGNYIVTLIASSGGICTDTIMDTITVNALPIVNFKPDSVCIGKPTTFTDASFIPSGNISAWSWDFGDPMSGINNASNLQNPTHIFSSPGTYTIKLVVTSASGCVSSKALTTVVFPGSVADFSFSPVSPVNLTDVVAFTDLSTNAPVKWWWNFGDKDTSVLKNPDHHYLNIGTYDVTLIIVTQNGCLDTITKPLEVQHFSFYIPNAFTPGTDGNNDFFFGKGVGIVEYEMQIFDRWGNLIFYCKVKDLPQTLPCMWDGIVQTGRSNERVQEDVYVWKVELIDIYGESHSYIGRVTVVK